MFRRTRKVPLRFGAWVATLGISHARLRVLAGAHLSEVLERGETFVRDDALARINHHLAEGHEVVVATGSLEVLAREILLAEGLSAVIVVGSSVRRYFGGMVVLEHCFGEHKIPMLAARGFVEPWDFVYSDHQADLPLLLRGKKRYLVNPQPSCASRLIAELGATATVVSWS
ncbi:MAG: haloacid dehalogenase-like hydrolase [Xanthomonadales bacterium]|nr:haloacid dehalogenase-like hydrolase [Xanthomonadales bacterium]